MGHWLCTKPHWVPAERLHWGPTLTVTQDIGQAEVPSQFGCVSRFRQDIYKLGIWSRAPCLSMSLALAFASPRFFPLRQVREVLQEEWLEQRRCRQYVLYSTQSFQWHYTCQRLRSLTLPQVSGWSKRKKCLLKDWAKFLYFCCPSLPLTLGLGEDTWNDALRVSMWRKGEPSWGQEVLPLLTCPCEHEFWCARKQTLPLYTSPPLAAVAFIQLIQTPWWHKFTTFSSCHSQHFRGRWDFHVNREAKFLCSGCIFPCVH